MKKSKSVDNDYKYIGFLSVICTDLKKKKKTLSFIKTNILSPKNWFRIMEVIYI